MEADEVPVYQYYLSSQLCFKVKSDERAPYHNFSEGNVYVIIITGHNLVRNGFLLGAQLFKYT